MIAKHDRDFDRRSLSPGVAVGLALGTTKVVDCVRRRSVSFYCHEAIHRQTHAFFVARHRRHRNRWSQ